MPSKVTLLVKFLLADATDLHLTDYLNFAKLQYVASGFRCQVITGSLMRLY